MSKSIEIQLSDASLLEVNRTFVSPPDDHVFFCPSDFIYLWPISLTYEKLAFK